MPRSTLANTRTKWITIGLLWFVFLFNYADRQAIFSLFPLIKTEMHLSDVELGILGSCFMWMYALCGPFTGWLTDRLSRKWLILGSLLFWSAVTGATAIAHTYQAMVWCRALGGLGEAFYFPAAMSMISDYHDGSTRSRAMSLHQTAVYAGSIAGGSISALVGQHSGWRSSFLFFGGCGIALGILLIFFLREPTRGQSEAATGLQPLKTSTSLALREILGNRIVLLLIGIFMGANFVAVVFLTWLPTFLYKKFHMSLSMAGLNASLYLQAASFLGVLCGGYLADRFSRQRGGGRQLTQAVGLLFGAPFLFLTGWTLSIPLLVLAMIGFGYFKGLYDANIIAGLYDVVSVQNRGTAAGIANSLGWLGGGLAPVIIAIGSARFGMSACISATGAIYLVIGLLMLLASQWVRRESQAAEAATPLLPAANTSEI
ncbi:MAG: MFS transporter [Edaphobacter sp.]|uniref:MFS transporter n=1 Tax=Edaphobacter sp. TaxID=1934404 RepID=UPI002397C5F2|nr:MFS transporter [Edaphobacter sp.]MDE1178453.1 MFS transporter [Edaphobacter sp.]